MQDSTLHIKVSPEMARALKELSEKRNAPVGELVRQAIQSCYQIDLLNLNDNQKRALEAFRGGYISLGKLAEEMGMSVLKLRKWLDEHGVPQNNSFLQDDLKNA